MNVALVFAGGSGQRMKNSAKPKQFLELYGKPIIIYTLEVFERHPEIDAVVIPCIAGWENYLQRLLDKFGIKKVKKILTGGKDTQESKMIALRYLQTICKEDDIVLLHDAVRPLVTEKLITDNLAAVREYGNGITCVPFTETAIVSDDGKQIDRTIIRNTMYVAKAPQSFYFKDVLYAHEKGENMPYTIKYRRLVSTYPHQLTSRPCCCDFRLPGNSVHEFMSKIRLNFLCFCVRTVIKPYNCRTKGSKIFICNYQSFTLSIYRKSGYNLRQLIFIAVGKCNSSGFSKRPSYN